MACPGLTAACGLPTAPAQSCADRVKRIVSAVPGLMVFQTSLDLCTAPARSCTDSSVRRVGSAEGLTAACGLPRTYGRLWPANRTSARLHRSWIRRVGSAVPEGRNSASLDQRGETPPVWICVLHQREAAPTRLRVGWAEGLTAC